MTTTRGFSTAIVYILFTLTGVGLVFPGALLPVFLTRYALHDGQGGALLFTSFVGSGLGALLARGTLPYSLARGAALTALGAICLGYAASVQLLSAGMFVFGLGLGITMTSASLLQSRNQAVNRAAELTRLNLLWSLGATAGPWLGLRGASKAGLEHTLLLLAGCFLLMGGMATFCRQAGKDVTKTTAKAELSQRTAFLLLFAIPLATGIEATVGGWLTTYAERMRDTVTFAVAAGTCFWAGMLVSRFTQSFPRFAAWSNKFLLVVGPILMLWGFILLLFFGGLFISVGAFVLGLGAGPMYPLLLAFSLGSGERSNVAFLIAGCGSSLLPFLTGQLSGALGGLRWGLAVPFCAAMLMLLSTLSIQRGLAPSRH